MVNCSIVTYRHTSEEITLLLDCILKSCVNKIYIIDNSPTDELKVIRNYSEHIIYIFNDSNVG